VSESHELTPEQEGLLKRYDEWLQDGGPAALVIRESLEPVEGPDGVFFPATFAGELGTDPGRFQGGYNVDTFPDGTNVCLLDTVGSQGNRMEPLFTKPEYAGLVPQVNIKINEQQTVNLLDAGHRSGDAIVRCSSLKVILDAAFQELLKGNAQPLAKVAPTSLVFGVWDSRGSQAKWPRLVSATIRAFNVHRHSRHAQYNPVINFNKEGLLDGIDASDNDLAAKGYVSQPIGKQPGKPDPTHGGVQLMRGDKHQGSIRRDAILGLAALRRLAVLDSDGSLSLEQTLVLRRYILGLALTVLTATQDTYLRQGCNLVPADEGKSKTFEIVHATGRREHCHLTHVEAKQYAEAAANAFGLNPKRVIKSSEDGPDRDVPFEQALAAKDIKGDGEKLSGVVVSIDATERKFTLKGGKKGGKDQPKEIEVATADSTTFHRGKVEVTFDELAIGAKIDVEVSGGIAVKVKGKK